MFAWVSRLIDFLRGRCSWCGESTRDKLCFCEGDELFVYDDSEDLEGPS